MFEKIVDGVYDQLRLKLATDQAQWSYFDLTGKSSEDIVRKIFLARYEGRFSEERLRIMAVPAESGLPFTAPGVVKAADHWIDELKRNFLIAKSEVEQMLRESLLHRLEYIAMPLATVEAILFTTEDIQPVGAVVAKFREFEKFKYYPDALEKYAQAKSITHLNKVQLRLLINEINQSLFGKDALDNVLKLCGLIMKEINDMRGRQGNSLEIDILMKSFGDRSLRDFEVALNIEKELGNEQINLYGLRQVLNRFIILKEKKAVPSDKTLAARMAQPPVATPSTKPKDTTDMVIEKVKKDDDSGELIDLNAILGKQVKRDKTDEFRPKTEDRTAEKSLQKAAKTLTSTRVKFAPERAEEVTGEFIKEELVSGFSDDTQAIRIKDIKESDNLVLFQAVATQKDEQIFLKHIFSGDENSYREFASQVNRMKTWKEAIVTVDDMLNARKVDPYSKEAIRLSDVVYMRFYPPADNQNN